MTLRSFRPLIVFGLTLLWLLTSIAADTTEPAHPPRPQPITRDRPASVQVHCAVCHAVPHPHDLARKYWPGQLDLMAKFMKQKGLTYTPEMLHDWKRYYVGNSLETLPELPPDIDPDTVEKSVFSATPIGRLATFDATKKPSEQTFPPMAVNVNVVDLDRNGEPDVLVADAQINTVSWLRKVDGAWIETALVEPGKFTAPGKTEAFDFDYDGDLDVAVAVLGRIYPTEELIGKVVVLVNDGAMGFTPVVLLSNVPRVADVRPADLDNDGDWDYSVAMFGCFQNGAVGWLESKPDNEFQLHHLARKAGAIHVPVHDIDEDGRPDVIAVISQHHEEIVAYLNRGGGKFESKVLFQALSPSYGSSGIELVDLDQDGDHDILYTNGDAADGTDTKPYHGVQWLENRGGLQFTYHDLGRLYGAFRAIARDLDQDGDLDIAVASLFNKWEQPGRQSLLWLENDGAQTFQRHGIASAPTHLITIDAADLTGDGRVDILSGSNHILSTLPPRGRVTLWRNMIE